ncbi:hypothetical protein ACF8OI_17430 [Aeromonas bivalvium]|uniref:TraB/GumN family protein n=1 Tax=Aeromonas bivalvium TaxID=440079 RepID=A0ABW9GSQ6_9GAMM
MSPVNNKTRQRMFEWKVRLSTIVWFVLFLGFLASLPLIIGWAFWLLAVTIGIAAIIAMPAAWVVKTWFDPGHKRSFVLHWMRANVVLICMLSIALAAPIYYLAVITESQPLLLPQATLSNGHKTIVFQGMQHIASDNFYKSVVYDIERALADGYIIYYEGVQTATPESKEYFSKLSRLLTGNANLARTYKTLGDACGLKFQSDYFMLFEADKKEHPERHIVADVDAIDLKHEYERLMSSDPGFSTAHVNDFSSASQVHSSDATVSMVEWLQSGTEGQKKLAGIVCRGAMTLAYTSHKDEKSGNLDPLILDFRNQQLVNKILNDSNNKIFITYGANHFSGIFDLLKQKDPSWTIATVKWLRPVEMPKKEHQGSLLVDAR